MHVPIQQHRQQLLFLGIIESASVRPFRRILIRSEKHFPPNDVAVVVLVAIVLVMNAMHFRRWEHETHPAWSANAGVIEELAECGA